MSQDIGGLPNFQIHLYNYYQLVKPNVEASLLSSIPLDQNIRAEVVKAIFKATVEAPNTLMEIYACYKKGISSLVLESPPAWMTVADWVQGQKEDPTINQVVTWVESKKLDTVKMGDEMSQELKQYLRQRGKLCLQEGVLYWHSN